MQIDDLHIALADIAELAVLLETELVARRRVERHGRLCQLAIGEADAQRLMRDVMRSRFDQARIGAPLLGGGQFQHLAHCRAHLAGRLDMMAQAA